MPNSQSRKQIMTKTPHFKAGGVKKFRFGLCRNTKMMKQMAEATQPRKPSSVTMLQKILRGGLLCSGKGIFSDDLKS